MGKQTVRDLAEADVLHGLSAEFIPSFMGKLQELAGVSKSERIKSLETDTAFARSGKELAEKTFIGLTDEQRVDFMKLMHSGKREQLEH